MLRLVRKIYRRLHAGVFAALRRLGWNVARTADFYSPLPVLAEVAETRELWDRPSELVGLRYDLEAMKALLSALVEVHGGEFEALPPHSEIRALGYGPGFPVIDRADDLSHGAGSPAGAIRGDRLGSFDLLRSGWRRRPTDVRAVCAR